MATARSARRRVGGSYTTLQPDRVPILSWAREVEGQALVQATNLSNLPFAIRQDIESVMAASTDLIRPTRRLTPMGVVKG